MVVPRLYPTPATIYPAKIAQSDLRAQQRQKQNIVFKKRDNAHALEATIAPPQDMFFSIAAAGRQRLNLKRILIPKAKKTHIKNPIPYFKKVISDIKSELAKNTEIATVYSNAKRQKRRNKAKR